MALDPTPAGPSANTYATVAEYKTYWGTRLFSTAQLAASDGDIESALQWAARLLDRLFRWRGTATTDTQVMAWPRTGLLTANGYALDSLTNPQELKNAQSEFAGQLITGDRTADNGALKVLGSESQLTGVKAGSVSLSFAAKGGKFDTIESLDAFIKSLGSNVAYLSKEVPDAVRYMIPPSWYVEGSVRPKPLFAALG